jgi:DNA-binding transcriptional ArsR family regulator
LIDQIRKQIEERLDQIHAEERQLRHALSALGPSNGDSLATGARSQRSGSSSSARSSRRGAAKAASRRAGAKAGSASATLRGAPGETKARVLKTLAQGKAMTAGEVAAASGLARASVSTTLSKLAKSGELVKAQRGYQLPRRK